MPRSRRQPARPESAEALPPDTDADATPRNVLIELPYTPQLAVASATAGAAAFSGMGPYMPPLEGIAATGRAMAFTGMGPAVGMATSDVLPGLDAGVPPLPGLTVDPVFPPVEIPRGTVAEVEEAVTDAGLAMGIGMRFAAMADLMPTTDLPTYVVRGQASPAAIAQLEAEADAAGAPIRIFRDPPIQVCPVCPGGPPVGTDMDVERLLGVAQMHERGMDGTGVLVAIVDTGINLAYLNQRGKHPQLDVARSWVPRAGLTPGDLPVDHGTMCAYDVCIAAPRCTLLDIPVLLSRRPGSSVMEGLLSDALLAYSHLVTIMRAPRRPGEGRSLVVNNSWGMFHPSWDFAPGTPGNYSDDPSHPFSVIVGTLARYGADILFAAGNCGTDCPDSRCQGVTDQGIYGANSHPSVLCVAGVDVTKQRVGYSTIGPGRLSQRKPDLAGYTHFRGSGVYAADGGTSAATPVVAGVVAALRSQFPYSAERPETSSDAIRDLLTKTAENAGVIGHDYEYGWGIINGAQLGSFQALQVAAAAD